MPIPELFGRLKGAPSNHAFTVVPIPGHEGAFLGMDSSQRPALFVRATEHSIEPSLRTSHVSLRIGQEYRVAPPRGEARTERLHALLCEATDEADTETFLVLVEAFLARYGRESLSKEALTGFFQSIARLFSVGPSADLKTERQGLWGELFLMQRVRGFRFWAPWWHSEPDRKFDFSSGTRRVEVKTAIGDERIHNFAHRQIYEIEGERIMVVSILLRKEDSGLALRELIREARVALQGSMEYLKLEQAVRQAGMESPQDSGPAFDATEAEKSLSWYRAADAPHFAMAEPPGVSQTHYRVDLSTATALGQKEIAEWLGLWAGEVATAKRSRGAHSKAP